MKVPYLVWLFFYIVPAKLREFIARKSQQAPATSSELGPNFKEKLLVHLRVAKCFQLALQWCNNRSQLPHLATLHFLEQ